MKETSGKGMGNLQTNKYREHTKNILKVLMDEQWHNSKEICKKVKISNVTLWKHLKELKPLLENTKNSSTYPHENLWKANSMLILMFKYLEAMETGWQEIKEKHFRKENLTLKDLKEVEEDFSALTNSFLDIVILDFLTSEDLQKDEELLGSLLEIFVWENYKVLTLRMFEQLKGKFLTRKD